MSIHHQLKNILLKKFPDMKFVHRSNKPENFWVDSVDLVKIIETKDIPKSCYCGYMRNNVKYYSSDNILHILRSSTNPHHILDYLIPLNFSFVETPLLDVVRLFDKYGIRGKYNYDMSECSNCLNFKVQYYYHCPIPLLVDVYSEDPDPMKQNLYSMFELQKCRCIEIDTRDWKSLKEIILHNVETHLIKLNAICFMEKVIKEAEEIKDVVDELGSDVIGAICSNNDFPFPLSECLKKFRITETNPKYIEIMSLFETIQSDSSDDENIDQLETLEENEENEENEEYEEYEEYDISSNKAIGSYSDDGSIESDKLEENCMLRTQYNGNTLYIIDQDYIIQNGEYFLNHPTLIKIAIRSGIRRAEQYVDKTWKLVQYITTYGRQAYSSLLKTLSMTPEERKQMFRITNATFEQNRMAELAKAYQKIEELESHIDINKTKKALEKYQQTQKALCEKDNPTVTTHNVAKVSISNDIKVTPSNEVFVVEKQPTKVKISSIIKKSKDPIKDNELETFLGL